MLKKDKCSKIAANYRKSADDDLPGHNLDTAALEKVVYDKCMESKDPVQTPFTPLVALKRNGSVKGKTH